MKILSNGYTARNATLDDLERSVGLMNVFSQHYLGDNEAPVEAVRDEWISPGFNPETDIHLVFTGDDQLVGYVEVWTTGELPVHPWVWWCVHPNFEQNGLGAYLLNWAEARASQVLARVPQDLRVAMWSGANSQIAYNQNTLKAHGMHPIRYNFRMLIEMDAPPPEPAWPEGIELRIFDPSRDDLAEIYRVDDEAFRDHFGHVDRPFEEGFARFKHFMVNSEAHDPQLWFLAYDLTLPEQPLVGICLGRKSSFEDPNTGWVNILGVLRPWRQRGIGQALLLQAFSVFYRRGFRKVGLGVDGMNLTGALRLYESVGMHIDRRNDLFEKELRPGQEISVQSL